jgi:hypothetical protein
VSPFRPLFVDAEAAIARESEQERIRAAQCALIAQLENLYQLHSWLTEYESRISAYMNLRAEWPYGCALGLSDIIQ